MSRYALVQDNAVENVIVADEVFIEHVRKRYQAVVALSDTQVVTIGDPYDPTTGKLVPRGEVVIEEPELPAGVIPYSEFKARITDAELKAINDAVETTAGARLFIEELVSLEVAGSVDLNNQRLKDVVTLLPSELMTDVRKEEILIV